MLFDIALALGILFGVVYLVWSLVGIALTVYVARKSLQIYRDRKAVAQAQQEVVRLRKLFGGIFDTGPKRN